MTLLATTRRRPAGHAFTTPVVRELAPAAKVVAGSAW
jgi:hypothetical protein